MTLLSTETHFLFSSEKTKNNYLGGAIVHELGHSLGLGHGQVKNSTMFYKLSIGQYILEEDDINGYRSIYHNLEGGELADINKGQIKTWVKGSDDTPILGAQVQAISLKKWKGGSSKHF